MPLYEQRLSGAGEHTPRKRTYVKTIGCNVAVTTALRFHANAVDTLTQIGYLAVSKDTSMRSVHES